MESLNPRSVTLKNGFILIFVLALVKLVIHLWTNAFASYGIFRDEFYYLSCSRHLSYGYVDHPPFSIYILALSRTILGESLFALRLLPAFAGALTVFFTGLMVRQLNGGRSAVLIACLAVIAAPIYLSVNTYCSMNCYDVLFWTIAAYALILIIKDNKPKHWLLLGVVLGLGLFNKIGMIWFGAGLLVALILTKQRKHLTTRWPYLAACLALLCFAPYLIWNLKYDFAHIEFIQNATSWKYSGLTPLDFILGQLFIMHPVTLSIWLAGLFYCFVSKKGSSFRPLGIIYITAFLILIINGHSKAGYLSPAYTMLFAAGAVQIEMWSRKRRLAFLRYLILVSVFIGGIFTAPMAIPILPVESYIRYSKAIGFAPESPEGKELAELPQFYADMFGWENLAKTVSDVYTTIKPEERSRVTAFTYNYGEAGAIEYYREKYDLPAVVSGHNNYWIWGSDDLENNYEVFLFIGGDLNDHNCFFEEVEQASIIRCRYCIPYENNQPIYVCRKPNYSMKETWDGFKHYD